MGITGSTPVANAAPAPASASVNQRRNNAPPIMRTNAAGMGPRRLNAAAPVAAGAAAAPLSLQQSTPAAGAAGFRGGKRRRNQRKTKRNKSKKNKKSNKN